VVSDLAAGTGGAPSAPDAEAALEFTILGAEPVEYEAAPAVRFQLHASEPSGREIYTIALAAQVQVDPARRTYDGAERERLVELFGAPERWGATTRPFRWARVEVLVPSFTGQTLFELTVPCSYDLEIAAAKYFDSLGDGEVPLSFHFNGTILYAGAGDRLQVALVPWSCSSKWRMPVAAWRRTIAAHYPGGGWIRLQRETLAALGRAKARRGAHSYDDAVRELLSKEDL
jgi:Family of unknown function (DUF6084)